MGKGTGRINEFICIVLFCFLLFSLPVMAQEEKSSGPVMKIDLGVTSLNLSVGESYTFQVKFEPEDTVLTTLDWYVSDESVISVDPLTDTVIGNDGEEIRVNAYTLYIGLSQPDEYSVRKCGCAPVRIQKQTKV